MRSDRKHFEVWCANCQVTFPAQTRKCIHCGSATAPRTGGVGISHGATPAFEFGSAFDGAPDSSGWSSPGHSEASFDAPSAPYQEEVAEPGAPSVGRSILGSLGTFLWIGLLIAFSLAGRVCGE